MMSADRRKRRATSAPVRRIRDLLSWTGSEAEQAGSRFSELLDSPELRDVIRGLGWMVLAAALAMLAGPLLPPLALVLGFVTALLAAALLHGFRAAALAAAFGAGLYGLLFLPTDEPFRPSAGAGFWLLAAVAAATLMAALLAGRIRDQASLAERRARHAAALLRFSSKVNELDRPEHIAQALANHVAGALPFSAAVLLPAAGGLAVVGRAPEAMEAPDPAAAGRAFAEVSLTGNGTRLPSGLRWLFLPLTADGPPLGLLALDLRSPGAAPGREERELLHGLCQHAAEGLRRTRAAQADHQAQVVNETEKLRAALLSSLSHDLRTPLASIIGSVTALRNYGPQFTDVTRDELLGTIQEEAERLNRFVGNLLDMTRLGSGALKPKREWSDIEDVIGNTLSRMASRLSRHSVALTIEPELPLLNLDYVLIEQVLVNLLDNAAKYSADGSSIAIAVRRDGAEVVLTITDEGTGIPDAEREQVFDMFYRVKAGDRQVAGTGLGLSICRGIVEAHGGTVLALSPPNGTGTCMEVRLPIEEQPPRHAEFEDAEVTNAG